MFLIYSYYNTDQIQALLNAVVMLMGSTGPDGDYLALIRVVSIFGLMIAITAGMVRARGEEAGMYIVMMAIFYGTLFVPRVTVTIQDGTGTGGAPVTVANVPIGLAFFASTTSRIGHWMTERTETVFALPDPTLNFTRSGLMGGVRALHEGASVGLQDPVLRQDMIYFMRDCINPELAAAPGSVTTLLQSTSIWSDMGAIINPGRVAPLSDGTVLGCADLHSGSAANTINARLPAETNTVFSRLARTLYPGQTVAQANATLTSLLPAAEATMSAMSASASAAIQQRMMINMLNETSGSLAQILDDPSAAQNAMASAMAAASANASYVSMGNLASQALPLVRNSIELVIIGVFPIILLLVILAGAKGGMVLRSYVMTLLWVELWAPLYAIVNFVGTLAAGDQGAGTLAGATGVSVANLSALSNTLISAKAVMGMLTISVPAIALALVRGGEAAMSGVVSGMLAASQRSAAQYGGAVGVGSAAAGNIQWGTYSAHNESTGIHQSGNVTRDQVNTAPHQRTGAPSAAEVGSDGSVLSTFSDGSTRVAMPVNTGVLSGSQTFSGGSESGTAAKAAKTAATEHQVQAVAAQNATFSQVADWAQSRSLGTDSTSRTGHSTGTDRSATTGEGERSGHGSRATVGDTQTIGGSVIAEVGAGVGADGKAGNRVAKGSSSKGSSQSSQGEIVSESTNLGNSFGGSVSAAGKAMQKYAADIQRAQQSGNVAEAQNIAEKRQATLDKLMHDVGYSTSDKGGTTGSDGISASHSNARQHLDSAGARYAESVSLENTASTFNRNASNASGDPYASIDGREFAALARAYAGMQPQQRQQFLRDQGVAINGGEAALPKQHADGSPVTTDIAGRHRDDASDPKLSKASVGAVHAANLTSVPQIPGGVGAGAVIQPSNLTPDAVKTDVANVNAKVDNNLEALQSNRSAMQTRVANATSNADPSSNGPLQVPYNSPAGNALYIAGLDLTHGTRNFAQSVLPGSVGDMVFSPVPDAKAPPSVAANPDGWAPVSVERPPATIPKEPDHVPSSR